MTTQVGNRIIFNGQTYYTYIDPFRYYLFSLKAKERPSFTSLTTSNHLGYSAVYEIRGDKLFMIEFDGNLIIEKGRYYHLKTVGLDEVFQGQKEVFVSWFTGGINMETEDQSINRDYQGLTYSEDELYVLFEKGVVKTTTMMNSKEIDRIFSLEYQSWDLQYPEEKKTIWDIIKRKFSRRRIHRSED
jgi:hypothetical protein